MDAFETMRSALEAQLCVLLRRHDALERDMTAEALDPQALKDARGGCLQVLRDRMECVAGEMGRIRSAIRRIHRREFDVCIHCGGAIPLSELRRAPLTSTCPECHRSYPRTYDDEVRLQHERLRRDLRLLDRVLLPLARDDGDATDLDHHEVGAARVLLRDLDREIRSHHAVEERPEQLVSAGRSAPRLTRQLEALMAEHAPLTEAIADLIEVAQQADGQREAWRVVARRFAELASAIRSHEEREAEILASAHLDDLGVAD